MSTGNQSPWGLSCRLRSSSTMPGSTAQRRPLHVEIEDAGEIFRAVDHQRLADGLPACDVPPPRGQHGHAFRAGNRDRPLGFLDRARRDHAQRHDLVMGGVGRVAAAGEAVELHVPAQLGLQPPFQARHDYRHGVVPCWPDIGLCMRACLMCGKPLDRNVAFIVQRHKRRSLAGTGRGPIHANPLKSRGLGAYFQWLRIPRVPVGRHFLHIPGPTPVPDRILRAMDTPDHRPPRSGIRQARQALPRRHQDHLQDHQPGDHLHRDRHRRLGSRAGQHAVARRQGADGRDRPVRHAVEEDGGEARPQARIHHDRLAHRRRPAGDRSSACARTRTTRSRRSACCTTRPRPAR